MPAPPPGLRPRGWRLPALTLALLTATLILAVVRLTPWRTLPAPPGERVPAVAARDFTAAQISRAAAYHRQLWPGALGTLVLALVVAVLLGLTPAGARLVGAVARPFGSRRWARWLFGTVAVTLAGQLATLPFEVWQQQVRRRQGIVVEGWGSFALDVAIGYAIGLAGTLIGLGVFYLLVRRVRAWWAPGAVLAAALVVLASFVYPIVVEPAFNDFRPMPAGPLRDSLLQLARSDGVAVSDVAIADESKRTTAINAYVSGIGASRRIVVYDTTLQRLTEPQLRSIVAHELGHVKRHDVAIGTGEAALAAAAAVCLLFLALRSRRLLRLAGVDDVADPRSLALVLAVVALLGALTAPAALLVSRRVEARADVHALNLTRDPAGLISLQTLISVSNVADLDPSRLQVLLYADHPTAPERIATARTWELEHGR